jgi:hypothetical protein
VLSCNLPVAVLELGMIDRDDFDAMVLRAAMLTHHRHAWLSEAR